MIKNLILLLILATAADARSQQPPKLTSYQRLYVKPHFPGTKNALDSFIHARLRYPDDARESGTEGESIVRFMVDEQGVIEHIEIVKSSDYSSLDAETKLDAEAKRIVAAMPRWIPGQYKGRKVRVLYLLPIIFRLD